MEKIYTNYFIPHFDNDPRCLQHKIFFDISFFLGKRGLEGFCNLKKDSFQLKVTSEGKEYYELTYNEATKKSQGDDNNEMNDQPILLSQEGKRRCPVGSLKLYISKLSHIPELFQKPNVNFKYPNHKLVVPRYSCWRKHNWKILEAHLSKCRIDQNLHKPLY